MSFISGLHLGGRKLLASLASTEGLQLDGAIRVDEVAGQPAAVVDLVPPTASNKIDALHGYTIFRQTRCRLHALNVDGSPLVIAVQSPDAAWATFVPIAERLLATVVFDAS